MLQIRKPGFEVDCTELQYTGFVQSQLESACEKHEAYRAILPSIQSFHFGI